MKKFTLIFLFIIFYAGYLLLTKVLFGDDNLVSIKGTLPKSFVLIKTYTTKKLNIETAYLIFRLNNDDRLYTLKADITGIKNGAQIFEGVALALKEAGEIEVQIRKAEIAASKPKVYTIHVDAKNIFNIIKKPANNSSLSLFLLLIILLFCSAYYWLQSLAISEKKPTCKRKWLFKIIFCCSSDEAHPMSTIS
jgi:hypothetical protein